MSNVEVQSEKISNIEQGMSNFEVKVERNMTPPTGGGANRGGVGGEEDFGFLI